MSNFDPATFNHSDYNICLWAILTYPFLLQW